MSRMWPLTLGPYSPRQRLYMCLITVCVILLIQCIYWTQFVAPENTAVIRNNYQVWNFNDDDDDIDRGGYDVRRQGRSSEVNDQQRGVRDGDLFTRESCSFNIYTPKSAVSGMQFLIVLKPHSWIKNDMTSRESFHLTVWDRGGQEVHHGKGTLYYGVGSLSLSIHRTGMYAIQIHVDTFCQDYKQDLLIVSGDKAKHIFVTSLIDEMDLVLGGSLLKIQETLLVSKGKTLRILPGTTVMMESLVSIKVKGKVIIGSTDDEPTLVTCQPTREGSKVVKPWGQLAALSGGSLVLENTWFTCGGGDHLKGVFGHSSSQPVIYSSSNSTLNFIGGGVVDNEGKGFGCHKSNVTLSNVLVSRCDMGGEFKSCHLDLKESFILEIPDGLKQLNDFDNDALRISSGGNGGTLAHIQNCILAVGDSDGIHQNGANVTIINTILDQFQKDGIAVSGWTDGTVSIKGVYVKGCPQGLAVGYGNQTVNVKNSMFVHNDVGIRFGDENSGWLGNHEGQLNISDTLILISFVTPFKVLYCDAVENQTGRIRYTVSEPYLRHTGLIIDTPNLAFRFRENKQKEQLKVCIEKVKYDLSKLPANINLEKLINMDGLYLVSVNGTWDECLDNPELASHSNQDFTTDVTSHLRMSGIQNWKEASVYSRQGEGRDQCGISFSTRITVPHTKGCTSRQVQIKSVYTNLESYRSEDHLRTLKTSLLDDILGTNICPPSFLVLIDGYLPQVSTTAEALELQSRLDCAPGIKHRYIAAVATDWESGIIKSTWPDIDKNIAKAPEYTLLQYIGNCFKSRHNHFVQDDGRGNLEYRMVDTDRCLFPETLIATLRHEEDRDRAMEPAKQLFELRNLCQLPRNIIEHARQASSINSFTPSIGYALKKKLNGIYSSISLQDKEIKHIFSEIDGRVSRLVYQYDFHCDNLRKPESLLKTPAHAQQKQAHPNGTLKGNWKTSERVQYNITVKRAPATLMAHLMDRILGLDRTPLVVFQRINVTVNCSVALQNGFCPDKMPHLLLNKSGIGAPYLAHLYQSELIKQLQFDAYSQTYHIDFIFSAKPKSLETGVRLHPIIADYFTHKISISDLLDIVDISRQELRDIADIFVLDFLTHNPGRSKPKNWAKSEGRMFAYDTNYAFWSPLGEAVCPVLLTCPPIFCSKGRLLQHKDCVNAIAPLYPFCRFTNYTFKRLQMSSSAPNGTNIRDQINQLLANRSWFPDASYCGAPYLGEQIAARVSYVIGHVKQCIDRYGNEVFIDYYTKTDSE